MGMNTKELARLYFREVWKITEKEELSPTQQAHLLYKLLDMLMVEVTRQERIQFTTLFSRLAYVGQKYELPNPLMFSVHKFRRLMRHQPIVQVAGAEEEDHGSEYYQLGLRTLIDLISSVFDTAIPPRLQDIRPHTTSFDYRPTKIRQFYSKLRVVATKIDRTARQLTVRSETYPDAPVTVQYDIDGRNELFNPTIDLLGEVFPFPVHLNLLDVEVDEHEILRPRAFILEPDYLVDVTAIAGCFTPVGTIPMLHLLKKLMPFESNPNLMVGNIANFFLDELMNNPEVTFRETFRKTFHINPLAFAVYGNQQMKDIMDRCQGHFVHLKQVVHQGLKRQDIQKEACYLEPSFYSEVYGIQGRLDVLYLPEGDENPAIIELKSGKPWKANAYGLSHSHFVQTLLYELLLKSTYGKDTKPTKYILYSVLDHDQLKFAPTVNIQQMEALQVRNQIVGYEGMLMQMMKKGLPDHHIITQLRLSNLPKISGFAKRDLELFERVYNGVNTRERKYFDAFVSFTAKEHQLAKTGMQGLSNRKGLASLWLSTVEEKQAEFSLISHLELLANQSGEEDPVLIFKRTSETHPLANFRNGDIAVLYPWQPDGGVLESQIFKCTVVEIGPDQVQVRLRSKQFNQSIFEDFEAWNLEHDLLDSGFTGMYRNLFAFLQQPQARKDLMLGVQAPMEVKPAEIQAPPDMTEEQQAIFQKMVAAKDYFLLWGPPGTGKTSVMLKAYVRFLLEETDQNILLLAYTNRAVDEICASLESIRADITNDYLRIGSRYSTAPRFQNQLLNEKIATVSTRKELNAIIQHHRIVVGTVSSVSGKQELFKLKQFHTAMIDEASQLLEPMLIGLLPKVERFVLIGDHLQLPAVVAQAEEDSLVEQEELNAIGIHNLRTSLFERLFRRCRDQEWHWAYAQLCHQGRMHQDIMAFPSEFFYDNTLHILPDSIPFAKKQQMHLMYDAPADSTRLEQQLLTRRLLALDSPVEAQRTLSKVNNHEAEMIGTLIGALKRIYDTNGIALAPDSIGVITPYRAQIAQIKEYLENHYPDEAPLITIDTVERYQGGARDVVLISLCVNQADQLHSLVSLSEEGIDRKLNVALTRARKQLIIVGNQEILRKNDTYKAWIERYGVSH